MKTESNGPGSLARIVRWILGKTPLLSKGPEQTELPEKWRVVTDGEKFRVLFPCGMFSGIEAKSHKEAVRRGWKFAVPAWEQAHPEPGVWKTSNIVPDLHPRSLSPEKAGKGCNQ